MAFYADPPNYPLIPYHVDGTIGWLNIQDVVPTQMTGTQIEYLTRHYGDGTPLQSNRYEWRYVGLQFAEPIDIHAWRFVWTYSGSGNTNSTPQYSTNATNFTDGTWTNLTGSTATLNTLQGWQTETTNVMSPVVSGVKYIKWGIYGGNNSGNYSQFRQMLIYGQYTNPNAGLKLWHPTLDQELTQPNLYFGDVLRNTSSDLYFRVKNTSTQQANGVTVGIFASYEPTPANAPQFTVSNGGAFASSVNIGDLTSGSVSSTLTVRRQTTTGAALAAYAVRLRATATSWT